MEPLLIPPMSQRCSSFVYRVYAAYIQSPFVFMLLFEGSWNLSWPFLSYLDFVCRPFLVQLLFRAHYGRVLPHYTALLSTSCWMMGDALMASFQRISSHRLQIIYSGIGFWSYFECLETCSHHWQDPLPSTVLGIHQCPLIDGFSQVFDLNTFIHTC